MPTLDFSKIKRTLIMHSVSAYEPQNNLMEDV